MLIRNHFLPFCGFTAINLFGLIFVRWGKRFSSEDLNHERIHSRQMRELLWIPFYLIYIIEWLFRLMQTRPLRYLFKKESRLRAYYQISFEREAYEHQKEPDYLNSRTPFAWRHYL